MEVSKRDFPKPRKYALEILRRFGMIDRKAMTTPMTMDLKPLNDDTSEAIDATLYRQIIGSLMYLSNTRPYICFAVNTISQYMVNPKHIHLVGAKHVMIYLKGTLDYGLRYASNGEIRLHGFTDSDWKGSSKDRKTTSRCFFSSGSGMTSWFGRKNTSVSLSRTGAEYIVTRSTCSEAVWLLKMLERLFDVDIDVTNILYDNQSFIKMI